MGIRNFVAAMGVSVAALSPIACLAQAAPATSAATPVRIDVGSGGAMLPPEGWTVTRTANIVRFAPPENNVAIAVVPVPTAKTGLDAAAQGWAAAKPGFARPVRMSQPLPARNGWDETVVVNYETSPAEQLGIQAVALRKGSAWTVVVIDGAIATLAKRGAQINTAFDTLRPAAFAKESFAGKTARKLDAARIAALKAFVEQAMREIKVPGVGLAVIQDGKIVYEGGVGVKDLASGAPVDKDTLFMIASNTKGMSTLLLAELVEDGKLDWDKPVTDYLPNFRLGSDATTKKVLVKHLVCACTGLPRKDMQWLFNTSATTSAQETFTQLAATEPTSGFGEVFQYNNLMASAAGYLGAHILYPNLELGAAYDRAMQERIFGPLGMASTTFSMRKAMAGDWAKPYDTDLNGKLAAVDVKFNDTIGPYRPAGGAWSSAHDMALYVINELNLGKLPNGKRLISEKNLLARRVHNVPVGENVWYGMGLEDDASSGVSVIQHGGSLFGYKSNWFAVPSAGVGVVVLTNSDTGYALTNSVKRRLLELLYDGKAEAVEDIASTAKRADADLAKFRSEVTLPVVPAVASKVIGRYANADLGPLTIANEGGKLMLRATSIWAEIGTKTNKDGTTSIVTVSPGFGGADMLVTTRDNKRALVLNDAQHEYAFVEVGK
jgi:CubicO group peptidase (beta-lactamase class C family)